MPHIKIYIIKNFKYIAINREINKNLNRELSYIHGEEHSIL